MKGEIIFTGLDENENPEFAIKMHGTGKVFLVLDALYAMYVGGYSVGNEVSFMTDRETGLAILQNPE